MQVLISNVMASTIVVSIGVLISKLLESIIFILLYSTLRIYTGGYHAKTSLSCNIVFPLAFIMTLVQEQFMINNYCIWLFAVISYIIIVKYSPVRNVNRTLDKYESEIYHIRSIIISTIMILVLMFADIMTQYLINDDVLLLMNIYSVMSHYMKLVFISIAAFMMLGMYINQRKREVV